jgi:hypothetical protein
MSSKGDRPVAPTPSVILSRIEVKAKNLVFRFEVPLISENEIPLSLRAGIDVIRVVRVDSYRVNHQRA